MQLAPLQLGFDDYTNKTRDKEIDFIFPNPTAGLYKCVCCSAQNVSANSVLFYYFVQKVSATRWSIEKK